MEETEDGARDEENQIKERKWKRNRESEGERRGGETDEECRVRNRRKRDGMRERHREKERYRQTDRQTQFSLFQFPGESNMKGDAFQKNYFLHKQLEATLKGEHIWSEALFCNTQLVWGQTDQQKTSPSSSILHFKHTGVCVCVCVGV